MLANTQTVKKKLLQTIDILPDYKLQEVLDFVEFLLFKDKTIYEQATPEQSSQQEILTGLGHIRETIHQTYGVYKGDLVAEARAKKDHQMDLTLNLDVPDESSH